MVAKEECSKVEEDEGIPEEEHRFWTSEFHKRCDELSKSSSRFPVVLAAASGFPLYTNLGSSSSRTFLTIGLAISGVAILLDFARQHCNIKHLDKILNNPNKYSDFHHKKTSYGTFGDYLFWIRGVALMFAGGFVILGIWMFRLTEFTP